MQTSSELITISQLVDELKEKNIVIPLLQRNYKWGVNEIDENQSTETETIKGEATAEKLLDDIIRAKENNKNEYTIGMLTFYVKDNIIQVIDGQQRLITLSLLAKSLGKYNEFIHIKFERDTDKKERESFLEELNITPDSVDVRHMHSTYIMFNKKLNENYEFEQINLFDWLLKHLKIIRRYTENEPLQEFLNINEKKTEFSSTDYDRAYQLKYQSELQKITPSMIIKEHKEIEKYLYVNDDIFNLVKIKYPKTANRMDLIFEKIKSNMEKLSLYYEKIDSSGDKRDEKYKKCYEYLVYCHNVFRSIHQEIEQRDNSNLNVNIYNAVMMLYKMDKKFKFFDLIDIDDMDSKTFEQKVKEQFNLLANSYGKNPSKNAFMHSQLFDEISTENNNKFTIPESAYKESENYIAQNELNLFEQKVNEVEAIIEKGKNYSELVKGGKKSFLEILNTCEIKQIIVPSIQRDYTFGCNTEKTKELLFDISKTVLRSSIYGLYDDMIPQGSAAKVVFNSIKNSKLWDEPGYFDEVPSKIKKEPQYEFYRYNELCKLSGFCGINDIVKSWGYNEEKCILNDILHELTKKLVLYEEDYKNIKENKYFLGAGKEEFLFSVIFGYLDDGDFYLYDGQQRVVTLVYLASFLINQKYNESSEETKKDLKQYIELLKKFKFEDRKEANDLLQCILDVNNVITDVYDNLSPYIIDHSTYSIVNLLKTYNEYKNEYGKKIISFDLDYIMNKIIFEFSVVKEASVADQMYMDLNSKNVILTPYEKYKAKLVYMLSTRFIKLFDENWKFQLDNLFLDKCYENNDKWEKNLSDKAEKLEINIIHWCFKMACMEYGISISEISDTETRLQWMDEYFAEEAVKIVGDILNNKIFFNKDDESYFKQVKNIVKNCKDINEFSEEEFILWFYLRYNEYEIRKYKFEKTNKYVKVYNWEKDDILNSAKYWISLSYYYQINENNNPNNKTNIIKFILQKFHSFWMEGFLQAELIENIEGLYTTNNDSVIGGNNKKADNVINFYSEYYLTKKPKCISWYEYLYNIKLNEMLDVKRYELVKVWENAEYKKLLEEKTVFQSYEKKMAYKNAFGDYNLWSQIKNKISNNKDLLKFSFEMDFGVNISDRAISEIKDEKLFMYSRIRKKILEQETSFDINIECSKNFDINEAIKKYILENIPYEVMDSLKNQYYFDNNTDYLYEYKSGLDKWERTEVVKAGKIAINITEFTEKFRIELKKITNDIKNNMENTIRFNWWAYNEKMIDEKEYKKTLNDSIYDKALETLNDTEKFKMVYNKLFGLLPHD